MTAEMFLNVGKRGHVAMYGNSCSVPGAVEVIRRGRQSVVVDRSCTYIGTSLSQVGQFAALMDRRYSRSQHIASVWARLEAQSL